MVIRLGIDIGGSGIKGAPVDLETGELAAERLRVDTPEGGDPDAVAAEVARIVEHFGWPGPFGCGLPAVVQRGVARTAANISKRWIGLDAAALFARATNRDRDLVAVANDADVAGMAELRYGPATWRDGITIFLTLGTGVGSAIFHDGVLLPNTELGHLEIRGEDAERRAAASARIRNEWSWEEWAGHLEEMLDHLDRLFTPDRYVLGGGISSKADKFVPLLERPGRIEIATRHNRAGVVGAALLSPVTG